MLLSRIGPQLPSSWTRRRTCFTWNVPMLESGALPPSRHRPRCTLGGTRSTTGGARFRERLPLNEAAPARRSGSPSTGPTPSAPHGCVSRETSSRGVVRIESMKRGVTGTPPPLRPLALPSPEIFPASRGARHRPRMEAPSLCVGPALPLARRARWQATGPLYPQRDVPGPGAPGSGRSRAPDPPPGSWRRPGDDRPGRCRPAGRSRGGGKRSGSSPGPLLRLPPSPGSVLRTPGRGCREPPR